MTIKDIAKISGYALGTVSRALNNHPNVSEEARKKILEVAKQYNFVNNFLQYAAIPDNLKIIFSAWPGMPMENPHNLPVANVIFKGQEPADNWKICGGNCSECACRGVGCWELKKGENIAFYEH